MKKITSQIELDRVYEIKFYELCNRLFNLHQNPDEITNYLKSIIKFIPECKLGPIMDLRNEIFSVKYKPLRKELMKVFYYDGLAINKIAKLLNASHTTILNYLNSDELIFARAPEYILMELRKFIPEHERLQKYDLSEVIE